MRIIFDVWIDVQRRWVYLEGIFFGSADIKNLLPSEFSKFKGIDSEFTSLMKKVAQKPLTMEVCLIPNLQKTLERLLDMLSKIQKALGDYLETQRSNFPRFYFVGDEDLLEIIGNSKEITNIQRHFPKMFAGITTIESENGDDLKGMYSREGEHVPFKEQIKISTDPVIYVWLNKLQNMMQTSLADKLNLAVKDLEVIDRQTQQTEFLEWIEKFPAQIVVLSLQVSWSHRIEESLKDKQGATLIIIEE